MEASMLVASLLRNRIPALLAERDMKIADLQRLTLLSYPSVYSVVKSTHVDDRKISTMQKIANALGVQVGDLYDPNEAR
jgi:DNA-binding Xre family transcriptional regulator